jgi:N-acetylmuramoyl-L-alanine amidase
MSIGRTVSTISENREVQHNVVFIIDAGHGGEDGGAVSCTGVTESAINLQIAIRLDDLLHLLGYETVMIRRTDTSVYTEGSTIATRKLSDLKHRTKIVNNTKHGILLSIHQNFFPLLGMTSDGVNPQFFSQFHSLANVGLTVCKSFSPLIAIRPAQ